MVQCYPTTLRDACCCCNDVQAIQQVVDMQDGVYSTGSCMRVLVASIRNADVMAKLHGQVIHSLQCCNADPCNTLLPDYVGAVLARHPIH